jgi:hypothetical protein
MDPYTHTTGAWLHRNQLQQEARHIRFDFQALSQRAVKLCAGSESISTAEKIEGGFNRSFIMTMDNDAKVVARIPTKVTGSARLTANSEVATIEYSAAERASLVAS